MLARILVLGASGFIGRRVVHALSQTSWAQPVAVSRHAFALRRADVESIEVDASQPDVLPRVLRGAAGVVNCIAADPAVISSSTRALFEAARSMPVVPRIVHLGSLAAYGSAVGIVDETSPLRGDLGDYSAVKAEGDRLAAELDFVVTLRPGIVYGPGSVWWSDRIARLLVSGRLGDLGAQGEGICNLVYVDDVATAVLRALRLSAREPAAFNLSTSEPVTWNEYFAEYAAALSVSPLRRISPARLNMELRLLAPPFKILEKVLRSRRLARWNPLPPLRPWLVDLCAHQIRMDVARAERILGMRWTPLAAGLATTAAWFRSGGRTP